jgi:hypothetical protein
MWTLAILFAVTAASRPPLPYVAIGACPFECCTYGTWVARRELHAFELERDASGPRFNIPARDSFEAITGNVHVLRAGVVRAIRTGMTLSVNDSTIHVPKGARFHLLDYFGEGGWRAWYRGRVVTADEFEWVRWKTNGDADSLAVVESWPVYEWWVKVRTRSGRTGWILMSRDPEEPIEVDGADPCG